MSYNPAKAFFLALLFTIYRPPMRAMDVDTSSSLLDLFNNTNWQAVYNDDKKREDFHQTIKSIHAKDKNAINAHDSNGGRTPLHIAICQNSFLHHSTLELLLSLKADVTQMNSSGYTPLELTCVFGDNWSYNTLLLIDQEKKNPIIVEKNKQKWGYNLLHCLMRRKDMTGQVMVANCRAILINDLMQAGYNIYEKDERGLTPVDYFLLNCNYKIESEEENMWYFLSENVQLFLAEAKKSRIKAYQHTHSS